MPLLPKLRKVLMRSSKRENERKKKSWVSLVRGRREMDEGRTLT